MPFSLGLPCPSGFLIEYGIGSGSGFFSKKKQDLLACANLCKRGIRKGQRTYRCCVFEWSETERMCKLHHECTTKSPHKEGLLTCRKKGDPSL